MRPSFQAGPGRDSHYENPEHPISRASTIPFLLQCHMTRCQTAAFFSMVLRKPQTPASALRASLLLRVQVSPLAEHLCGTSLCVYAFRQVRGGILKSGYPNPLSLGAPSFHSSSRASQPGVTPSALFSRYYQSPTCESSLRVGDLDESLDLEFHQPVVSEQGVGGDIRG